MIGKFTEAISELRSQRDKIDSAIAALESLDGDPRPTITRGRHGCSEPRAKSQEPRAKSQEPRAKSQEHEDA